MADDAQTPKAREQTAGGTPPGGPHPGAVWPAPADGGGQDAQAQDGSLVDARTTGTSRPAAPDPWALPSDRTPAAGGPGETVVTGGTPPWSAPSAPSAPSPSVHDQQTVTSFPALGDGPAPAAPPWAGPAAPVPPAASTPAANPFAPPAGSEPVPPPPIGPEGPGPVAYGYPGGGYGAAPAPAYPGWAGTAPLPSNGLGVTGLVLGIISAVVFCLWPVAILLGVLAVIFGGIGRGKALRGEATNGGQALAGIICGSVGIALGIAFGVLVLFT
ncbi:DUF4190 domain-containing protein [Streptomyces pilosus]|uniref:DUF4190 domain-containing protein n=1 Tax=Streptomyces pilosus TaxID=28893 RepID=UPI0036F75BDA